MNFSKELKRLARENLAGNYRITMGALLITFAIPMIIEFPFSKLVESKFPTPIQMTIYYIAEILIAILSGVLSLGINHIHLNIARKIKTSSNQVFICFKSQTDRYILGYGLYFIMSMLTAAPGFVALYMIRKKTDMNTILICIGLAFISLILQLVLSLVYGFLSFVMIDRQDMKILDCFKYSRTLIKGKKGKLFYLILSFIGLELLGLLSLGIGLLWVEPYKQQTLACFYRNATGEAFNEYV